MAKCVIKLQIFKLCMRDPIVFIVDWVCGLKKMLCILMQNMLILKGNISSFWEEITFSCFS